MKVNFISVFFTDGPGAWTLGEELGWHHLAMYSWSSQGALTISLFCSSSTVLTAAGCQEGCSCLSGCSQNYVWQLLFLAKISGMNFVRFESVMTPVQMCLLWVTVQVNLGWSAGCIPVRLRLRCGLEGLIPGGTKEEIWHSILGTERCGKLYYVKKSNAHWWNFSLIECVQKGWTSPGKSDFIRGFSGMSRTWISGWEAECEGRRGEASHQQQQGVKKEAFEKQEFAGILVLKRN